MPNFTIRIWFFLLLGLLAGSAQAQRIAAGGQHTISIHSDGTLWAWGYNYNGQLGDGTTISRLVPTQVSTDTNWKNVVAGYSYTLALKTDGTLWAWGSNYSGQLGIGTPGYPASQLSPMQVGTATWLSVSAGYNFALAVRADGTLWAWGYNYNGQLGTGNDLVSQGTPVQVGTATNWLNVSAGIYHSLALRTDGTLWAWGYNGSGQLGNGSTTSQRQPMQIGTATWTSIAAGGEFTVAIRTDGTLWTWGINTSGQLGTGTAVPNQLTASQVGTATTWQSVATGSLHTMARRTDGSLWAWGGNLSGQLGTGIPANQSVPTAVDLGITWQSMATGYSHSIGVRADGSVWAWGYNDFGQLGNGASFHVTPRQVAPTDLSTWQSVAAGRGHTLALRQDGSLWAWGDNTYGQLGLGTNTDANIPTRVGTATWTSVAAGATHSLAIQTDGSLWAWGNDMFEQLGLDPTLYVGAPYQDYPVPTQVAPGTTWRSVVTGTYHSLAIRSDGTLWAWGDNLSGELGLGASYSARIVPTQVGTATDWQSVYATETHNLAIRNNGTLWAWGNNYHGEIGLGTTGGIQFLPAQVGLASTWLSVAGGNSYSTAVRSDGTLWAWGYNSNGQLGIGTLSQVLVPMQVGTATNWQQNAGGDRHAAAIRADGSLWTWGFNFYGQLGTGTTTSELRPQQVAAGPTWRCVAAGDGHTAAIRADGSLWTWGYNQHGQLGIIDSNFLPTYITGESTTLAVARASTYPTWQLTPNPAHGIVQVLGLPAGPVATKLFDTRGRLVRTGPTPTVDLAGLAPGLYLLRATAGEASRTLRLVVE